MLYIFDKDGTLVGRAGNRPANTPDEQVLLPGVAEKIAELRAQGHKLALASNQGGVAWGFITEDEAWALMDDCAEKVGGLDAAAMCPYDARARGPKALPEFARDDRCRKPNPGMLLDLMEQLCASPASTVMVGDRESDRLAAEAAGCEFVGADEFFERCCDEN